MGCDVGFIGEWSWDLDLEIWIVMLFSENEELVKTAAQEYMALQWLKHTPGCRARRVNNVILRTLANGYARTNLFTTLSEQRR